MMYLQFHSPEKIILLFCCFIYDGIKAFVPGNGWIYFNAIYFSEGIKIVALSLAVLCFIMLLIFCQC